MRGERLDRVWVGDREPREDPSEGGGGGAVVCAPGSGSAAGALGELGELPEENLHLPRDVGVGGGSAAEFRVRV